MKFPLKLSNLLTAAGFVVLMFLISCSGENESEQKVSSSAGRSLNFTHQVTFLTSPENPVTSIQVAVADQPDERNMGLMDVNNLPQDRGMLFMFEEQQSLNFWMANTPLTLDIIFVNEDKEIVRIHHSTQPFAEKDYPSGAPAKYVIETNGGFSVAHDIQQGMKVEWEKI